MLASLLLALSLAAAPADTTPAVDPRALYPRLFRLIEVPEADYVGISLRVDSLPTADPLAPLVNTNLLYFDYLAEHATSPELAQLVTRGLEFPALRAEYAALLRRDPAFNRIVTETVGRFLAGRGASVRGYDPAQPRRRLR
ncbi:MAG TPA: hypothetical protein VM890_04740, partial [Longimicrobium sp.]|nr:hypothetical protein [Longimicrobium sp.]